MVWERRVEGLDGKLGRKKCDGLGEKDRIVRLK